MTLNTPKSASHSVKRLLGFRHFIHYPRSEYPPVTNDCFILLSGTKNKRAGGMARLKIQMRFSRLRQWIRGSFCLS